MTGIVSAQPATGERLAGLDALRGVAACVVAFGFHAQYLFAPGTFAPGWGGPVISWLQTLGWTAVDLFFVLSGYVFAHVYLRGADLASRDGQGAFWIARIARLYPLHLALLLVCACLFGSEPDNTVAALAAHLVFAQALVAPVGHTFDGPTWSLSVEMLCYAVFALAAARGAKTLALITAAACLIGLTGIAVFGASAELTTASVGARGLLGFFGGQLLWRGREHLARIPLAALAAGMMAGLWLSMTGPFGPVLPLTLLAWPALLLIGLRLPLLSARPLTWLGDRSYAVYLLHIPMIDFVAFSTGGLGDSGWMIAAGHLGLAAATLAAADLVYRRFELPARNAVRGLWRRRQSAAVPRPA
ncbi:acyltransferase [Novosphingobium sp.]|uniref:acyltransferase family protein n=1 Tax=Novosphingobium sp. TaxID=1874826 RepID=UPI0025CBC744|nr:acyltransferase [Novosphingobium sp.]